MHLVYYEISTILHLPDSIQFYTLDYKIGSNSVFCSNVIVTILWRETIIINKRQVETHEHNQRGGGGDFEMKTIMATILKGRSKLKCSKLASQRALRNEGFWRVQLMDILGPNDPLYLFLMTAPQSRHGMMTKKGTSRNSCLVPYTLQSSHSWG